MDKHRFDRIVQILLPEMGDTGARQALVESALYGASILQRIEWGGAARTFTVRLVRLLHDYGEVAPGKPALVALLEEVRGQVGADKQTQIDALIAEMSAPPAAQTITPPPKTFTEGDLYVFISYARPDQAVAEKVEAFLKAAGVRVFRDTSEIREGANWDMTIEAALRDCGRMVLLLSAASMPYRKEVHREWFYFDQMRKPIYPLYIQACDLHSRLYAYNYIDARADLQTALDRLLKDLGRDFDLPAAGTGADVIGVFPDADVAPRTLPESLQALLDAVRDPAGSVVLSVEQARAVADHKPTSLTEYRLGRIAEWSLPRYALDDRFVNLTLLLDKGETDPQRWQRAEDFRFSDLRDVLAKVPDPAFVLLGAPGSGKSTLLRRLQLDHSIDRLRDDGETGDAITFFIQLNGYRPRADGVLLDPRAWLEARWSERYPNLPPLDTYLKSGKALLLLDALNEMPHRSAAEYHARVGLWRSFAQEAAQLDNRLIFSCRSLDYSASLSSPDLRVPQIEVQPMSAEQVRRFLNVYIPAHEALIWRELDGSPQFSLFQTPYFLKLLCEQVEATRAVPKGRASLFTGFVRQVLYREINGDLFEPDTLLTGHDHQKLSLGKWRSPFDLPERGVLIPRLSALAFTMQVKGLETEGAQVRIDYDDACDLLAHPRSEDILKAGIALNVLDEDITQYEIAFFHQLLQEFFAARQLAENPNSALVHVEWAADQVRPSLDETLAALADGDPLPPLPQTGWEETTLTAAPMAKDPNAFIRALIPHNLPLAARCAASAEVKVDADLKREIQNALIARTHDMSADLRARIAAGEALGTLGDPRFERRTGAYGDYLLPPLVSIDGGTYPIGEDASGYDDEKPAHTVELAPFQIGRFPVTNAEYALFVAAGGYEEEQWWDTDEAKAWLRGEGSNEGGKRQWRENRKTLQDWSEDHIRSLVRQNRITSKQAGDWITIRNWSDERFEQQLDEWYPSGKVFREPEYWNDARFNHPAQPVVGVTWFEARAYCAWLTANAFPSTHPSPPTPLPQGERGEVFTLNPSTPAMHYPQVGEGLKVG
ncbi:MAG: SUMF1/EgtB/PvdO family nonheme iron enzyme [Anaerolineae bacterium]|nr:SUMF1/EgtB/PvdO family nonheme iron enzyme [Anaerolineae bacterium]NUQ02921.1 SUMF1/EgtB/PvdO family nonheme iron enzyme [Anaerolineae bacterium]